MEPGRREAPEPKLSAAQELESENPARGLGKGEGRVDWVDSWRQPEGLLVLGAQKILRLCFRPTSG